MANKVNLNADIGEGFGAYDIGNDAELMEVIRSASIACGFHAGDPLTMRQVVAHAARLGASVGAPNCDASGRSGVPNRLPDWCLAGDGSVRRVVGNPLKTPRRTQQYGC